MAASSAASGKPSKPALSGLAEQMPLVGWDQVGVKDGLHPALDPDELRQHTRTLGDLASPAVGIFVGDSHLRQEAGGMQLGQGSGIHLVGLHASTGNRSNKARVRHRHPLDVWT